MPHALEAIGLAKTFVKARSIREILRHPFGRAERIRALRGVDLAVRRGEILSLLGPNGAGKTTLLKIFSCLVLPDEGRAVVGGCDTLQENRVKNQIGLVHSDERSFYWRLSARENLRFFARLYDVPRSRTRERIEQLIRRVDLTEAADRPFSGYSSGMKQRMAFARALLHDPPILLMDEPTRSLDPTTASTLRRFISEELRGRDGKTVLIATHDLREAESISDRVAILVRGRVREVGTPAEVRRWGVRERVYRLELAGTTVPLPAPFRELRRETIDGLEHLELAVGQGASLHDALRLLIAGGATIRSCDDREPDLEQAFARIVDAERGDGAARDDA